MKTQHNQVKEFHSTFRHPIGTAPILPDVNEKLLRYKMLTEEVGELYEACSATEYADAIVDILYVALGAAVSAGINGDQIEAAFAEVHRSNMSKLWSDRDSVVWIPPEWPIESVGGGRYIVKNSDGKIMKSPCYSPANLGAILEGGK
jgi:predicted HAD superfamily Cof-like phosphohydrolase